MNRDSIHAPGASWEAIKAARAQIDDYDAMCQIARELEDANIAKGFEITQLQEEIAALKAELARAREAF
jgi:outer membrane protein TolC